MTFFRETILPLLVGVIPIQIMFVTYEKLVLKTGLRTWIKVFYFPFFSAIAFLVVLLIGWILFVKLGI